ncbi:MAG: 3-deoxy-manno-octulosonate cytidylyltransferase [bacterium]|nr:3-deoxy-manno-octulosonate cytidylyltransferase [bacterium]
MPDFSCNSTAPFNREAIGVIPARCASIRFPNKPLALIQGVPMICWTLKRSGLAKLLRQVIVAAEDPEVVSVVQQWGGTARLVQGNFTSGSDRIAAAVRDLDAPVVVNIQGDEPFIDPDIIDKAIALLAARSDFDVTTAVRPILNLQEYRAPNSVKAVLDATGRCLYFSRSPIPAIQKMEHSEVLPRDVPFYLHIGLYCFRREALYRFTSLPKSPLEACEGLEQLRLLEAGGSIGAVVVEKMGPGINSPEDLPLAEQYALEHKIRYQ